MRRKGGSKGGSSRTESDSGDERALPVTRASCCTSAVFPVPVSPTRSTGSVICTAAATRSRIRIACPVRAQPPAPPPLLEATAAAASSSAGSTARPTATAPVPACSAGLCKRSSRQGTQHRCSCTLAIAVPYGPQLVVNRYRVFIRSLPSSTPKTNVEAEHRSCLINS